MRSLRGAAFLGAALYVVAEGAESVDVIWKDVEMTGMTCGEPSDQQKGLIVYPNDAQRHPLVAYAHGWTDGGKHLDAADFHAMFSLLASAGYIVVAAKAPYNYSSLFAWCDYETDDQLQALRWALATPLLRDRVDASLPSAVAGHSMGGLATIRSASNVKAVKDLNIVAAVAQHPAYCWHQIGCDSGLPQVPIMFTAGELDYLHTHAKDEYDRAKGVPKVFAEMKGVGHCDPSIKQYPKSNNWAGPPHVENHYILDWLNCYVKHNSTACDLAKCKESQSRIPTVECVSSMPNESTVLV